MKLNREKIIILSLLALLFLWILSVVAYNLINKNKTQSKEINKTTIEKIEKKDNNLKGINETKLESNKKINNLLDSLTETNVNETNIITETNKTNDKKQIKIKCVSYLNAYIYPNKENPVSETRKLEEELKMFYPDKEISIDGYYDQNEIELVKEFQREQGMNPDGVVGKNTRKKMNIKYCALKWYQEHKNELVK